MKKASGRGLGGLGFRVGCTGLRVFGLGWAQKCFGISGLGPTDLEPSDIQWRTWT